jgi:8-oxo-dGTP diphosphatase
MLDEGEFPALFGMTELGYAPIDARFVLLDGGRGFDERLVAHSNVIPFVGDHDCIVVGFDTGDWTVPGGTLEPGEHWRAALERELLEEAGAYLRTYTPFAVLQCHSRTAPYRPHLPHPDFYRLLGYGDVELGGAPAVPAGGSRRSPLRSCRSSAQPHSLHARVSPGRPTYTGWPPGSGQATSKSPASQAAAPYGHA